MIETEIRATRTVAAPASAVFEHLADLRTHWELAGGRVRLVDEGAAGASQGGTVRMRGPLGIGRNAATEVLTAAPPRLLEGRARIGGRTEAKVRWELEPLGDAMTVVELSARVVAAGPVDRLLLALGARFWLERLFQQVLARLAALAPMLADAGALAVRGAPAVADTR